MISAAGIPVIEGDMNALAGHASTISGVGVDIADTGARIHTTWQGLAPVYIAPEAGQLLAATGPVQTGTASIGEDLVTAATILTRYADEVREIQTRLDTLRTQATEFETAMASEEQWDADPANVDRSNELLRSVNQATADFDDAQRRCAGALSAPARRTAVPARRRQRTPRPRRVRHHRRPARHRRRRRRGSVGAGRRTRRRRRRRGQLALRLRTRRPRRRRTLPGVRRGRRRRQRALVRRRGRLRQRRTLDCRHDPVRRMGVHRREVGRTRVPGHREHRRRQSLAQGPAVDGAVAREATPFAPNDKFAMGQRFEWTDPATGKRVKFHAHGADPDRLPTENAGAGPIYRMKIGNHWTGETGGPYTNNSMSPSSSAFDPVAVNDSHIPFPKDQPRPDQSEHRVFVPNPAAMLDPEDEGSGPPPSEPSTPDR